MQRNTALPVAALIVLVLVAAWAFSNIMGRRYSSGEAYPAYSTLRSDPLGSRALYESLDRLEGITTARNFKSLDKMEGGTAQALMLFHMKPEAMVGSEGLNGRDIQAFAARGGRVVITLDGKVTDWDRMMQRAQDRRKENALKEREKLRKQQKDKAAAKSEKNAAVSGEDKKADDAGKGKDVAANKPEEKETEKDKESSGKSRRSKRKFVPLLEVLGLSIESKNFIMSSKGGLEVVKSPALPVKEDAMPQWYSRTTLKFRTDPLVSLNSFTATVNADGKPADGGEDEEEDDVDILLRTRPQLVDEVGPPKPKDITTDEWTALATMNDSIVLAERRIGQGSIVVATDSYFVSNEALLKSPSPAFLAWLVGGARHVIFDETHLGTTENPGIMTLARRLHLEGVFIGGLILFGLFVWQSSSSLVPSRSRSAQGESNTLVVAGHGATAGLVSLLRRGIRRSELLNRCYEIWEKSARQSGISPTRLTAAHQILERLREVKVTAKVIPGIYRQISAALHSDKKPSPPAKS